MVEMRTAVKTRKLKSRQENASGIGVLPREMPAGASAESREDLRWIYRDAKGANCATAVNRVLVLGTES